MSSRPQAEQSPRPKSLAGFTVPARPRPSPRARHAGPIVPICRLGGSHARHHDPAGARQGRPDRRPPRPGRARDEVPGLAPRPGPAPVERRRGARGLSARRLRGRRRAQRQRLGRRGHAARFRRGHRRGPAAPVRWARAGRIPAEHGRRRRPVREPRRGSPAGLTDFQARPFRTRYGQVGRRDALNTALQRVSRLAAAAALAVTLAGPLAGCGVNRIPTLDEQAEAELNNLNAAYQRRADLIGNLVRTVEAAAVSERTTLREVTEARSRATSIQLTPEVLADPQARANFDAAQSQLTGALSRLLVVSENYPQLQTNQNFRDLQQQIESTENRINIQRRDYNEAVRRLNTEMRTFPGSIWASTVHGGVERREGFQAQAGAERAPQVEFNNITGPDAAPAR
ncbi:MAG: LemA family protein [Proteobacteria bacterium]|nr:LemA family protein [Pseudomonadota bacterium]